MTFNVGDRVYHTVTGKSSLGTIIKIGGNGSPYVLWDNGTELGRIFGGGLACHSKYSIKVFFKELKYDPMQQGDKDEDI